jgi:hypothetical protein
MAPADATDLRGPCGQTGPRWKMDIFNIMNLPK